MHTYNYIEYCFSGPNLCVFQNTHKGVSYKFNGKEQDDETGNYYYGARYYTAELGMWLSVDRMAAKYPSMTPYNFVMNNPVMLIDPNGDSVNYNSFRDWLNVSFNSLINQSFRGKVRELKNSDETYVFKGHSSATGRGEGTTSTDGDKIYINYSFNSSDIESGAGRATSLFHETEHAIQFEHGEFGFRKDANGNWSTTQYDLTDEMKAFQFGSEAPGTNLQDSQGITFQGEMNALGTNLSDPKVVSANAKSLLYFFRDPNDSYNSLIPAVLNNFVKTRVKNNQYYVRPYTPR